MDAVTRAQLKALILAAIADINSRDAESATNNLKHALKHIDPLEYNSDTPDDTTALEAMLQSILDEYDQQLQLDQIAEGGQDDLEEFDDIYW
jgi:hypothetical protein